jgi:hypothetical protein
MTMANLEGINRATRKGFVAYMMANPFYFQQQFELPPTRENILKGFSQAKKMLHHNPFGPAKVGKQYCPHKSKRVQVEH